MGRRTAILDRTTTSDAELVDTLERVAHPLGSENPRDYDPLLDMVGDARIVLIGEASHGTHEFYRERALITTRLIAEKGFSFVAVEGDWPEAYRVNAYVRGGEGTAMDALSIFTVFPTWMWGNLDVLHFVEWLRRHNDAISDPRRKVGFYGLDLYGLYSSIEAVISYLEKVDPRAAEAARQRYGCFEPFQGSKDLYAYAAGLGIAESCEDEALAMLRAMREKREHYVEVSADDSHFYAEMSAVVARDAERYYRSMYRSDELSWNLRDIHMMDTLDRLLEHFGPASKAVIWEHNTHIGDFRATADANDMVNVGQLTRERHPGESVAVGFGTYEGSVTAATAWGQPPQTMQVPRAVAGSYDNVYHQTGWRRSLTLLKPLRDAGRADGLADWWGQRAIGVVYNPAYERGNYVPTRLADRYDAYIHVDATRAIRPLNIAPAWQGEPADTYPTGY